MDDIEPHHHVYYNMIETKEEKKQRFLMYTFQWSVLTVKTLLRSTMLCYVMLATMLLIIKLIYTDRSVVHL